MTNFASSCRPLQATGGRNKLVLLTGSYQPHYTQLNKCYKGETQFLTTYLHKIFLSVVCSSVHCCCCALLFIIRRLFKQRFPFLIFNTKSHHCIAFHCICLSVICTMQKKFMNTPQTSQVTKESIKPHHWLRNNMYYDKLFLSKEASKNLKIITSFSHVWVITFA